MKQKINLLNWMLVFVTIVNIIVHRVWISQAATGMISETVSSLLLMTIYGELLLFLGVAAGVAVILWKRVSRDPSSMEKPEEFPKVSLGAAIAAFLVFSIYWLC